MNNKNLKYFKEYYSKQLNDTIRVLSNSEFEIDTDGDETDKIQGNTIISVQNSLSKKNLHKVRMIKSSLEKIEDGSFGECEECGEDIGIKRLELIPGCSMCVTCAEIAEKLQ